MYLLTKVLSQFPSHFLDFLLVIIFCFAVHFRVVRHIHILIAHSFRRISIHILRVINSRDFGCRCLLCNNGDIHNIFFFIQIQMQIFDCLLQCRTLKSFSGFVSLDIVEIFCHQHRIFLAADLDSIKASFLHNSESGIIVLFCIFNDCTIITPLLFGFHFLKKIVCLLKFFFFVD